MKPCGIDLCMELAENEFRFCKSCRRSQVTVFEYQNEDQMAEDWRDIPDLPFYQASDQGNIRGIGPSRKSKNKVWRILSPFQKSDGYWLVQVGKGKKEYVHRLVARAFLKPGFAEVEVNHKDADRSNNALDNLEWMTKRHNYYDMYARRWGYPHEEDDRDTGQDF